MTELLLNEEEMMLRNAVREFADAELAPRAARYDESGEFPYENFKGLAQLGILGSGHRRRVRRQRWHDSPDGSGGRGDSQGLRGNSNDPRRSPLTLHPVHRNVRHRGSEA